MDFFGLPGPLQRTGHREHHYIIRKRTWEKTENTNEYIVAFFHRDTAFLVC